MPRKKLTDPIIKWNLRIRQSLASRVELHLMDPLLGKPRYGARRKLVEGLLSQWLEEQEGQKPSGGDTA